VSVVTDEVLHAALDSADAACDNPALRRKEIICMVDAVLAVVLSPARDEQLRQQGRDEVIKRAHLCGNDANHDGKLICWLPRKHMGYHSAADVRWGGQR